jgi:hypothetical protein
VKSLREPGAAEPHVRFDERRRETEAESSLRHQPASKKDSESRRQQLLPRPTVTAAAVNSTFSAPLGEAINPAGVQRSGYLFDPAFLKNFPPLRENSLCPTDETFDEGAADGIHLNLILDQAETRFHTGYIAFQ